MNIRAVYDPETFLIKSFYHKAKKYENIVIDKLAQTIDGFPYMEISDEEHRNLMGKKISVVNGVLEEVEEVIDIEEYKQVKIAEINNIKEKKMVEPLLYQGLIFENSEEIFLRMIAKVLLLPNDQIDWIDSNSATVAFTKNEFEALTHQYLSRRLDLATTEATLIKEVNAANSIALIDLVDWDDLN